MSDDELHKRWPELGTVEADLRRIGQPAVADMLVDAASARLGSSDVVGSVGIVLRNHSALRARLSENAVTAWDVIMADVSRAFNRSRFAQWLASLTS